jgi:hypothetical protein
VCIFAIALGVVWMIVSPEPATEQKAEVPGKRTLAYQQAISQQREEPKTETETAASPASETLTEDTEPAPEDPGPGDPAAANSAPPENMAALPGEGEPPQAPAAEPLPWAKDRAEQWGDEQGGQDTAHGQPPADPYAPGDPYGQHDGYGPPPGDPYAARRVPYAQPQDPYAARRDPYAQQDPYGRQPAPYGQPQQGQWGAQPAEEWVKVIGSGTGMRATASIDAPILFAFPYGRQLKVVSRNDDWVEVSDPNTSTKGWMPAHALAPSAGPNAYGYGQQAYEEAPQERRGLFRRGGFADMINRAFGGGE